MTEIFYILLFPLAIAAFIGGLLGWVALARIGKLQASVQQLRRQIAQLEDGTRQPEQQADLVAAREMAPPGESSDTSRPPVSDGTSSQDGLPAKQRLLWLSHLRENWMIWLGGLCVSLSGIFLVKYSIDAGLLGPGARIAAAGISGLGLHGLAEWLRRRTGASHPAFAALAGGASIMLYAAVLAALFSYEQLSA